MSKSVALECQLSEVAKLAALLSNQIIDAKIMRCEIPRQHITILVKAAEILQDRDIVWPPIVAEALIELADILEREKRASHHLGCKPASRSRP